MKKQIWWVVFLCIIGLPLTIQAKEPDIITFNINIQVADTRKCTVEEDYYAYFNEDATSYTRNFSLQHASYNEQKQIEKVTANYSNVTVIDQKIKSKKKNKNLILTIPGTYTNNQIDNFQIKYEYFYEQTKTNKDEFYFNIIDDVHEGTASSINFSITMPKAIDETKITFLKGTEDVTSLVSFHVVGTSIIGYYGDTLSSKEPFAIRVPVETDYFISSSIKQKESLWSLCIPFIALILSVGFWMYSQKKNKKLDAMVLTPPHDFDCAEVAYLYHGYTKKSDLTTLVMQLASQGYLQIVEQEEIQFVKQKDYDRNNAAEKIIFEALFHDTDIITIHEFRQKYDVFEEAKHTLDNEDHQERIFTKNKKIQFLFFGILLISSCSILWNACDILLQSPLWSILIGFAFSFGFYLFFMTELKTLFKNILGLLLIGIGLYVGIIANLGNTHNLIVFLSGCILTGTLVIGYRHIPKRSTYGMNMLQEMSAFRRSLLALTSLQLQEIEQKNPEYFYHILPYAYVFDIYETWLEKGKEVITRVPSWYQGPKTTIQEFYVFYRFCIQTMTKEVLTLPINPIHLEVAKAKIIE